MTMSSRTVTPSRRVPGPAEPEGGRRAVAATLTGLALAVASAGPALADTVEERLERRGFPSVFQAWSPVENTGEGEIDAAARHDLYWRTLEAYGLAWDPATADGAGGRGRATGFTPDSVEAARAKRARLLAKNPDMVLLTELRYRDGPPGFLDDLADPWWLVEGGERVLGWPEGGSYRVDFRKPEVLERMIDRARAIVETGVVDGVMLDVWNENEGSGFGDARIELIRGVRAAVGDALVVVNTNEFTAERSAPYVNGLYLETSSRNTPESWARYRSTMQWAGANLASPAFTALETWRDAKGGADANRGDPDDIGQMRATTALALVASDGFALFADPNELTSSDHLHDWYDFWDVELGRPTGPAIDLVGGVVRRDYDNGIALYSPPGATTGPITFDRTLRSVVTGTESRTHGIAPFDGDLLLRVDEPPAAVAGSVDAFDPPARTGAGSRTVVSVGYAVDAPADLVVSLQDTSADWRPVGFARTSVTPSGSSARLAIDVAADAVPGADYAWTAWLVAPGGDWPDRLDSRTVRDVTLRGVDAAFEDRLDAVESPRRLAPGQRFEVDVDYEASAARTVNVSLQDTANGWVTRAFGRVDVTPGVGTATVVLELADDAPPGGAYTIGAYLTPPGETWPQRLDDVRIDTVTVR